MPPSAQYPDFNSTTLIGRLTKDPQIRHSAKIPKDFFTFTVIQNDLLLDCAAFDELAEVARTLEKGFQVLVSGRLRLNRWSGINGEQFSRHQLTLETLELLSVPRGKKWPGQLPSQPDLNRTVHWEGEEVSDDSEVPF